MVFAALEKCPSASWTRIMLGLCIAVVGVGCGGVDSDPVYDVWLNYFSLNNVDAFECTNETAPHVYYTFTINGQVVASRNRDDFISMRNGENSPSLMTSARRVNVPRDGGVLQIAAQIWDSDTGGGVVDADDPIADWALSWNDAQIRAADRDQNGSIHAGIGIRANSCGVSFWYSIDEIISSPIERKLRP